MRFDPSTGVLLTDSGDLIKRLHCPLEKRWEDMEPIGAGDLQRLCGSCGKCVINTEGMSDEHVARVVAQDPEACLMVRLDAANLTIEGRSMVKGLAALDEQCPLPRIRTAWGLNEINALRSATLRPVVVPMGEGRISTYEVLQNIKTGEVRVNGDARCLHGTRQRHAESDWRIVIPWKRYAMGKRPGLDDLPVAAYMVPTDLRPGTRVWILDLIDDVLMESHQGHKKFRESCAALWTGRGFKFLADPASRLIG